MVNCTYGGCLTAAKMFDVPGMRVLAAENPAGELYLLIETTQAVDGCRSCGVVAAGNKRREHTCCATPPFGHRPVVAIWRKRAWRCTVRARAVSMFVRWACSPSPTRSPPNVPRWRPGRLSGPRNTTKATLGSQSASDGRTQVDRDIDDFTRSPGAQHADRSSPSTFQDELRQCDDEPRAVAHPGRVRGRETHSDLTVRGFGQHDPVVPQPPHQMQVVPPPRLRRGGRPEPCASISQDSGLDVASE